MNRIHKKRARTIDFFLFDDTVFSHWNGGFLLYELYHSHISFSHEIIQHIIFLFLQSLSSSMSNSSSSGPSSSLPFVASSENLLLELQSPEDGGGGGRGGRKTPGNRPRSVMYEGTEGAPTYLRIKKKKTLNRPAVEPVKVEY